MITAIGPGRANLIGDHTDYTGGLVLPLAIDLATTVTGERGGNRVVLTSDREPHPAVIPLDVTDPTAVTPHWARYVAGVVAALRPTVGFTGSITSTIPASGGLSSSAALEVAVALALGFDGSELELAQLTQQAEHHASGVPCGIMDQLASAAGVADHALLIDCHALSVTPVPLPATAEIRVIDSGEARALAGSEYAQRRHATEAAEAVVGPLRLLRDPAEVDRLDDPQLRARARHVISENQRVRRVAEALAAADLATVGDAMNASHASLRDDFDVSTPTLNALVERLQSTRGVHGARLTGAGFGGCAVAVCDPGALDEGWHVRPAAGATVSS